MKRANIFTPEHDAFRAEVRRFVEKEVVPFHYEWEERRGFPRELWLRAGEIGILCCNVPEAYGGAGADWLYNAIVIEEFGRAGASGPGSAFMVHSEIVAPYILHGTNEALKREWLPKMVGGERIGALGLTEPCAGSDLKNIRTRAIRDGDDFVINGQKIFISNGMKCDFIVLACKTAPDAGAKGISLILVEADREGFDKGRQLEKIGLHAADTAELFFADVRVPATNLVGEEGGGFKVMMANLIQERLGQAVRAVVVCETAIEWTVRYTRDREAFGHTIFDFQNTQFTLADLDARIAAARAFTDQCMLRMHDGTLDGVTMAQLKLVTMELQGEVLDKCLQLFGGYGYMREYPIARAFVDARLNRIAGGTIEVMKHIIGKDLAKRYPS
jgi:alkylation response protein AidB-like acyl-CoA dehydrogenase